MATETQNEILFFSSLIYTLWLQIRCQGLFQFALLKWFFAIHSKGFSYLEWAEFIQMLQCPGQM